jgi:hypothetical protein
MSAERCYRTLLRAYPLAFRAEYEREMLLAFRQARRDATCHVTRFWLELLWDVARSAPALRLEAMRARRSMDIHITEEAMKTMGIIAALVGVVEMLNALTEGVAGGLHRDGLQLVSVVLCLVGGAALVAAGIAMFRRGARVTTQALGAAAACLVAFAITAFVAPVMSGFAMLLGLGFPIVLLAFLIGRRGRDAKLPGVA